ncbi:MAG: serine/threonine-protein kinase [Isosphaeraceae bacterium]
MSDDSPDTGSHSVSEFLGNLERSGILTDSEILDIKSCLRSSPQLRKSSVLAEWLVEEGRLTDFQARRLLVGKTTGLVFGRYILLDRLGKGSMGRVLKARHRLMDRVVALKVVSPAYVSSLHSVARFLREMKIVGMLDHPNVVRAFDADQQDNSPYIVMEYLEGEDLERVLRRRGMLPPDEVVEYITQAAWGLAHAHEKGVVHRDIKPTNLFLTTAGAVKVLDLGLGAFVDVSNHEVKALDTDEGFVVGTTDYMSPEQISGRPIDARTDLFSLGCTMYRLLTGTYAFPGMTKLDRLARRLHEPHVPITEVRPNLPTPLVTALDRMLALQPEERVSSAVEVAEWMELMIPGSRRLQLRTGASQAVKPSPVPSASQPRKPEAPLDWSRIESALHTGRNPNPRTTPSLGGPVEGSTRSTTGSLRSHRQMIEAQGEESGRGVQKEYRKKVIELTRERDEQLKEDSIVEAPTLTETWLEKLGEKIGDFLAEPSAGNIFMILTVVALIAGLCLVYALQ